MVLSIPDPGEKNHRERDAAAQLMEYMMEHDCQSVMSETLTQSCSRESRGGV